MSEDWPDDIEFRKFAAVIADAVTVAINSGCKLSSKNTTCLCPEGCFFLDSQPIFKRPTAGHVANYLEKKINIRWADCVKMAAEFARGFDYDLDDLDHPTSFHRLGATYRKKFLY